MSLSDGQPQGASTGFPSSGHPDTSAVHSMAHGSADIPARYPVSETTHQPGYDAPQQEDLAAPHSGNGHYDETPVPAAAVQAAGKNKAHESKGAIPAPAMQNTGKQSDSHAGIILVGFLLGAVFGFLGLMGLLAVHDDKEKLKAFLAGWALGLIALIVVVVLIIFIRVVSLGN